MIKATPNALSYSRLDCYASCPLRYKLQYIAKQPAPPADPLLLGGAAHDFFEAYGKHCLEAGVLTDLGAWPALAKAALKAQRQPLPEHLLEDYNDLAERFVNMQMFDAKEIVGIEMEVAFKADWTKCGWFDKKVAFRAKMDLLRKIEDHATITDYKTGYKEGNPFQMETYAVSVFTLMPEVNKVDTEFAYIGSGHTANKTFEREDMPRLVDKLEEKCARVSEDTKFEPTPGDSCRYCPYVSLCTAKPSNLLTVKDAKEARQVAEDLFVLEAQVAAKKDALKGWVAQHGDVETGSGRWGYSREERIKVVDMRAFASMLELKGIDPMAWLSITGTELKKLYKKNDGLEAAVEPLLNIAVSEKFKSMKLKKEEVEP